MKNSNRSFQFFAFSRIKKIPNQSNEKFLKKWYNQCHKKERKGKEIGQNCNITVASARKVNKQDNNLWMLQSWEFKGIFDINFMKLTLIILIVIENVH